MSYHSSKSQNLGLQDSFRATLQDVVTALNNPAVIGARLAVEMLEDHHNGFGIKWPSKAATYLGGRDKVQLRLRLEQIGLRVPNELLCDGLMLVPMTSNALRFLNAQGDAA